MITEDQLEQRALQWFQDIGWRYNYGPDIAHDGDSPQRSDYRDVVLIEHLKGAMARINPQLPSDTINEVAHAAIKTEQPGLGLSNRTFHNRLLSGIPVSYEKDGKKLDDHAFLIDFNNPQNNQFLVVNQFTVQGIKQLRRPDIVVFVNGLPLAVIELKNPADENADIWHAYNQIQTYKDEISDLFVFNEALIISDGLTARVGSLTASQEWFLPWNAISNENDNPLLEFQLEKVVRGFFNQELFLDYIRHFILFEQEGDDIIKKIAGYHQFHGVRDAVKATLIASAQPQLARAAEPAVPYGNQVEAGSGKAGVFWHTQGSGKSISMCFYAGKLLQQPEMSNPTLVVVTDRNDLDGQLWEQFSKASDLLKQIPIQVDSREELRTQLSNRQSGGVFFTTIQKFSLLEGEASHPVLCDRPNVVVMSDEAHRSQYGIKARLDTKTGQYKFGYAKHLRDALPKASFIGFTGTPIALEDKDTRAVFGDYVSIYDIQDAVEDGATVPIFYESRLAKLDINSAEIEELNREVDEVMEDEEDIAAREQVKSRWAQLAKLVGSEPRLKEVAEDLVEHFETRLESLDGKAMIVCMSRQICVNLFDELVAIRPAWMGSKVTDNNGKELGYNPEDGAIRIVMTGSASDKEELQQHVYTRKQKKRLERRFKDPNDPLKLVIVRDMWLTGFDAPSCHTMYVDKPMRGHNLAQAIARVNRVFKDKPGGLVVDYIGIAAELKETLKTYTESRGKGKPTIDLDEAYAILQEKIDIVRGLFHGFDYSDFESDALELLLPAMNHITGRTSEHDDRKKRFLDHTAAINKALALCKTHDEVTDRLRKEVAFFNAVRSAIIKFTTVEQRRTFDERNSALKYILDNAVIAEGVIDIFDLAGMERPNIGLLSDAFLEDVRAMKERNLAVELLEKLLRDEIKSNTRTNVVQEKKFMDRLQDTLRRYHNRFIDSANVMEELINMAKDFQEDLKRNKSLNLSPDELAFYDALTTNESAVRELKDETLKKIATELTEKLRKSTTVDWQKRESVRAKLRIMVRRLLRKYRYPPDGQKAAIDLVLQQAETLSEGWSMA